MIRTKNIPKLYRQHTKGFKKLFNIYRRYSNIRKRPKRA